MRFKERSWQLNQVHIKLMPLTKLETFCTNPVWEKELEKINKYQDLKREIIRMWTLRQVEVVPVVVGALGTVSKN